ncbi:MAG: NAD(P)H-dependent glycerol-3-phosphate dehydrogenase [Clostridia bacterium]|nr:NAD(P)H-dependent glycerol-3-phosphate dehydrogenase [Clostridia bacterium]
MKISIIGTGAYGIALAKVFNYNANKVTMWTKFQEELDTINIKRENIKVLPGVKIPKEIALTCDMEKCIKGADIIVIAVPMNAVRLVSKEMSKYITKDQVICITSKGIENDTNKLMSEVVKEEIESSNICVLSGPSFAIDLVNNFELGLVVASNSTKASMSVKISLENDNVVVNEYKDVVGVQVCASIKNVFAIILGILEGLGKSDSTKATMLTILLNDLKTVVQVMGGKTQTVYSYAGIGDFLLTCMSNKSRNYTLGINIGKGFSLEKSLENMNNLTVEGLHALNAIYNILEEKEIKIDSIGILYNIIYSGAKPKEILSCIK